MVGAAARDPLPPRPDEAPRLGPVGAIAALVGFYVGALLLACALVGVAVLLAYGAMHFRSGWVFVAAVACVIAALVVVWSILPRYDRFDPPGPELHESDAPMLFAELRELASAVGQAAPSHVYIVPQLTAFVTERGGIVGIGSRRVLGIGLPLLEVLTTAELRSVLAHELGHFHGGDTKTSPWLFKVRAGFVRSIANLERTSSFVGEDFGPFATVLAAARVPFVWFGEVFMRSTMAMSRAQERRADALAVQLVGSDALVGGLEKAHAFDGAFDDYFGTEVAPVLGRGRRPPILAGFREFLSVPRIAANIESSRAAASEHAEADQYDTHPPLCERIAHARELAVPTADADDRPARTLVRDVDWIERKLVHFGRGDAAELDAIAWADVVALHVSAWRDDVSTSRLYLAHTSMTMIPRGYMVRQHAFERCGRAQGDPTDRELELDAAARWSAAIGVALVDLGWTASTSPGDAMVLRWGDIECRPLTEVTRWLSGQTTQEQWHARARQIGLDGVDLGASVLPTAN